MNDPVATYSELEAALDGLLVDCPSCDLGLPINCTCAHFRQFAVGILARADTTRAQLEADALGELRLCWLDDLPAYLAERLSSLEEYDEAQRKALEASAEAAPLASTLEEYRALPAHNHFPHYRDHGQWGPQPASNDCPGCIASADAVPVGKCAVCGLKRDEHDDPENFASIASADRED